MKVIFILPFLATSLFLFISCNSGNSEKATEAAIESFLNDSLYRHKNFKGILKIDWNQEAEMKKLFLLDSASSAKLLLPGRAPIEAPYYGARCFATQSRIDKIQPIILYVSSDDYTSYLMITLNEKGKPIDYFEVAGGWFDTPHDVSDSTGAASGDGGYCKIIDERTLDYFHLTNIFWTLRDTLNGTFEVHDDIGVDSLHYRVTINNTGKFIKTLVDSVRVPAKDPNHEN